MTPAAAARSPLDTAIRVETPEGVDLTLYPAGLLPRLGGYLVDLLVRGVVVLPVIALLEAISPRLGAGVSLLIWFAAEWLYPVVFELLRDGQTPGKKAAGIRTVMTDGRPVELGPSVLRNVLRAADYLPALFLFGIVSTCLTRSSQRLGDLAASTLVVYVRDASHRTPPPAGPAEPPTLPLSTEDQRAVLEFASRAPQWSAERQRELAALLVGNSPDAAPRVHAWARWIGGKR